MSTIHQLLSLALAPALTNTWAVELPPNPTWPAAVFEVDSKPEDAWCAGGGYTQRENEARGWADMWQSVDRTAHDVFVNVLEGGQDTFKRLGNTLKASVLDVLYQMTVRKWIISIGTSVLGSGFGAAANAATGGGSGGVSTAINGASLLGKVGGSFGMGLNAGFSSLFGEAGLMGALDAGGIALGAGNIMGGLGTIAGALGPIALGVGAVVSLIKKLDDSGTIHTGALSQYSAAGGLASSTTHGAFGMGFGGVDYSAETEKFTGAMAQSIVQMLDSTATTFGKEAGYKAATAFADDTSKDGAWGGLLISKLEETIVNWDTSRTSRWAPKEFADGAAGRDQYLAAVAADVRVALESIGLPAWATGMLDKLGQGASIEQLAGAVDQINAAKAAFASFGQYMPTFAGLADSAISKLVDASGGVQALAGNMATFVDGFYTDAEKLAINTQNVSDALAKLGFEMPATRDEFKALVQAQIALGDGGAETTAKLLALSGAFAGFDGRDFVLRWGPLGGAYPADFETVFVATAEGITLTESNAVLRLRDKLTLLEKPIVRATFAGTGGVEGGSELAGVAKQRFFGTAQYPPLQLINASTRVYLMSTGRNIGGTFAVWDNGIQLTAQALSAPTIADFLSIAYQPDPGFFTIWPGPDEVYIRLGSNPEGDLRCSATIGKPSGSAWALADWLAEAGYSGTIIGSLPNLGHVVEDAGTTWLDMFTHIAQHQGAWFGFDRLGRFVAKAFAAPAGSPVMTLSRQNCLSIKRMPTDGDGVPAMQLSINAGTAWKSSLAAAASVTRQEFSKEQWSARYTYSDSAVLAKHPAAGSIHMDIAPRMTSAQWVALRDKYRAWFFVDRSLIVATVPLTSESMALDLGDVVRVQWPRFGLSGGKDFVIVATRYDLRNRQIEFVFWG